MKKLLVLVLLATSLSASAHGWHGDHDGYHGGYRGPSAGWWIGPAIIGGLITYEATRPYYAPAPVYVQPAPVYVPEPNVQFYCQPLNAYYPTTATCPAPWLKVLP